MRLLPFLPLLVVLLLAPLLYQGIASSGAPQGGLLPAPRPLPDFRLPLTEDSERLVGPQELRGAPALLNVWASWCWTCRVEHPFLEQLAARDVVVVFGLNYKDDREAARAWLRALGNPYRFSIEDAQGRLGLDLGVTGAPESYLLDSRGRVRLRHVGELNERVWRERMEPVLARLREES